MEQILGQFVELLCLQVEKLGGQVEFDDLVIVEDYSFHSLVLF